MQVSQRIAWNAVTNWAAMLVSAAVGLVLVPFLLGCLGKEGYGLAAIAGVVVSFTAAADLGLRGALSRHLAEQVALKNTRRFNELASTALVLYLTIGTALATACVLAAEPLARAFRVSPALLPEAVFLVRWYSSVSILLSFLSPLFGAVVISNNRFDLRNYILTGTGLMRGAFLFAVLGLTDTGLYGWAVVGIAATALEVALMVIAARRLWPAMELRVRHLRWSAAKALASLGVSLFTLQWTGLLAVQSDPIVLTAFLGPAAVALYQPALTAVGSVRPLVSTLADQLHPLATGLHVTGRRKELQQVLLRGTRYTLLMGVGVCTLLAVLAKPMMRLWLGGRLGEDYAVTAQVLVAWVVVDLFTYAAGSQWPVLLGMNRLRFLLWTQLPLAVLNLLVSIVLVGYTRLGVVGVVIPTAVIGILRRPIVAVYVAWVCGLTARRYFLESYLRPIAVLTMLTAAAFGLRWAIGPASWLSLGACATALGVSWAGLAWGVGLTRTDRQAFCQLLREWRRRGKGPAAEGRKEDASA